MTSSTEGIDGGAAAAAPLSRAPRWQNEEVLAWVRKRMAAGSKRDDMMAESKAGKYGWPLEGEHLPQNAVDRCVAIIHDRNGRKHAPKKRSTDGGKQLRELYSKRNGRRDNLLLEARIDISKLTQHLEFIDFIEYGIRDADPDTIMDIYNELAVLDVWIEQSFAVVASAMGNMKRMELIRKLRDTTGRTPEEARLFNQRADRLEAQVRAIT